MPAQPPAPARRGTRLLLLEFVTPERWVFNSRYYPFFKGVAAQLGIDCRWLCFGASYKIEKADCDGTRQYMDLDDVDLASLRRHVAALAPTHLILSHPVSAAVRLCWQDAGSVPAVLHLSDLPADQGSVTLDELALASFANEPTPPRTKRPGYHPDDLAWQQGRTDWLLDWLDAPQGGAGVARGQYFSGTVAPLYDAVMANPQAQAFQPHVVIMGGLACDHFALLADNPRYADIVLDETVQDYGCAYCMWYRGPTSDLALDPLRVAGTQLLALAASLSGNTRFAGSVDLLDIRLFRRLDRFVDLVLDLELPPTTFYFEPRLDRFLEVAPLLARQLPRLAPKGHRIGLMRMGAETLVEEENERYNKHVTLAQIDEALRVRAELERAFPQQLCADPTLGFISCSPWTTLDLLEANVRRAIERHLEPLGVWLYTPLIFFNGSPITRLAEREGLLAPRFDDVAMLYEAVVNQVNTDNLRPWRFRDERAGVAFALIVRCCAAALRNKYPDTMFAGDEAYRLICERSAAGLSLTRPDLFALEVIAAVRASSAPYDRGALLADALSSYTARLRVEGRARPTQEGGTRGVKGEPSVILTTLARRVGARLSSTATPLVVTHAMHNEQEGVRLRLRIARSAYELHLRARPSAEPHLFLTDHWSVVHLQGAPVADGAHLRLARRLVRALDRAVTRAAPHLFGGAARPIA